MSTLPAELDRLYLSHERNIPNPHGAEPGLMAPDGTVRAMVLELARPADWTLMSTVWRGVQTDFELPAPAIAVSGIDGYQLWFSLAEPVSVAQAGAFLESLRVRYLSGVATGRIAMLPSIDAASPGQIRHATLVPALQPATDQWSAFVAPDLAAIFSGEPWLDTPPNPDAQANVLARLECIKSAVFHALLERLSPAVRPETAPTTSVADVPDGSQASREVNTAASQENSLDPKGFLLSVMNDKTVELHLRIEAAKALLPYVEGRGGNQTG
ncbi:MAG: hypothetical protein V4713_12975 [Pseudomonadota bacterium]